MMSELNSAIQSGDLEQVKATLAQAKIDLNTPQDLRIDKIRSM
ncbi:MAG: DUF1843 domain-containing protein [Microcoleaceae cyanobacterium]